MRNDHLISKVHEVSWHRNGIGGAGFYAIRFLSTKLDDSGKKEEFLAILFDEPSYCAVISLDRLPEHGVRFGQNSWRGDNYEPELRNAVKRMESSGSVRVGPFAIPTE